MGDILSIILPVFVLVGTGYLLVRMKIFGLAVADGLTVFATKVAVPCLLFGAVASLDIGSVYTANLFLTFFVSAAICFGCGVGGARLFFQRTPMDAVSIGFASLFSNAFLLGIPIMERAFGPESLAPNFAIISVHLLFCYTLGTISMEMARAGVGHLGQTALSVGRTMAKSPMVIAALLGFAVNLSGLTLPYLIQQPIKLLAGAALPGALFGMGGLFNKWSLRRSVRAAGMVTMISTLIHPFLVLLLGTSIFPLSPAFLASAIVTAAMPTGINAYLFAANYDRATGASASAVLLATAISMVTISGWLWFLKSQIL